ncbi:crossover junction endodeoxyribonuclease RuvC [candidate division KSB1 bacterium]|nr:crossover junction endodeoxyribonuclease RuvC [candidate division KSB1 bacterium]
MNVVLGIDPGSRTTGFGVIACQGKDGWSHIASGTVSLSPGAPFFERLKAIYRGTVSLIETYSPDQVAVEDVFYSHNVKSALQLGQARGAALVAALNSDRPIHTYAAREVKQALTGNGSASKEQVRHMVVQILGLHSMPEPLDVSDALAIALCHALRSKSWAE